MNERTGVYAGIGLILLVGTLPLWWLLFGGSSAAAPELEYPTGAERCIESTEFMRDAHMHLLHDWRDRVVREGERFYEASDGAQVRMSLMHTCMECHVSREQFCTKCHDYAGVQPDCWNCHVDEKGVGR